MIRIAGGWGYNNLGDEAILAGYVELLSPGGALTVFSVDPERTRRAQRALVEVEPERLLARRSGRGAGPLLIAGGGFLNGNWQREILLKLHRLERLRGDGHLIAHGIEVRKLAEGRTARVARRLFDGADMCVRDARSADEVERLGLPRPSILPDGITFLTPYFAQYSRPLPRLRGKVLVNLLDISDRNDSGEAEMETGEWSAFCSSLLRELGSSAVGLVVGGGDYRFMRQYSDLPLIQPASVSELISAIHSADAILSVRMHPALLGTALGKPTAAVPYCGKVRPTLERIGVSDALLSSVDVSEAMGLLGGSSSLSGAWTAANAANVEWLLSKTVTPGR